MQNGTRKHLSGDRNYSPLVLSAITQITYLTTTLKQRRSPKNLYDFLQLKRHSSNHPLASFAWALWFPPLASSVLLGSRAWAPVTELYQVSERCCPTTY